MKEHSCGCGCNKAGQEPRRGFLAKVGALGAGAFAFLVPVGIGANAYLNPLRQKGKAELWVRVAQLDALTDVPSRITVLDDIVDAWSRKNNVPIGTVFVRKMGEGDGSADVQVEAVQAMCPHAGALVTLQTFEAEDGTSQVQFYCPSHKAEFELDGVQKPDSIASPRNLDTLDAEIRGDDDNEVWVRFQTFQTGGGKKTVAG